MAPPSEQGCVMGGAQLRCSPPPDSQALTQSLRPCSHRSLLGLILPLAARDMARRFVPPSQPDDPPAHRLSTASGPTPWEIGQ
jgi:hypothetical protein